MSAVQKRRRAKVACEPCRSLKRKCDGGQPCTSCVRFEYDCGYLKASPISPLSRATNASSHQRPNSPANRARVSSYNAQARPLPAAAEKSLRSLEANSGAAFIRRLALRIDPKNAPRAHLFAWNTFMGSRDKIEGVSCDQIPPSVIHILSQTDMETLAAVYFNCVDPIYGFIDRREFDRQMKKRWFDPVLQHEYDAVLCGVAALGYVYSHVQPTKAEFYLVHHARLLLEAALSMTPTVTLVTAWVLRVTYLRITGTPHAAWMASGILMHIVEAANLHCEPSEDSVFPTTSIGETVDPDIRRRIFGISQHLNTWMSFDMARSRIVLHNATTISPKPRDGDFTVELLELLPYSAILNPDHEPSVPELENALVEVLDREHTKVPSTMAQCNLMLCICRRLKSNNAAFTGPLLARILDLTMSGIRAAQTMIDEGLPWHHMANVPFQVVCILLAIDTSASIGLVGEAMQCLSSAVAKYKTEALQEALGTASVLILLHQKRKERCAARLGNILKQHPVPGQLSEKTAVAGVASQAPQLGEADLGWLDGLVAEIPSLQDIDLGSYLSQELVWDSNIAAGML
ncbi:protein RDR1 [Microdochium trichocladiopsis]|uniref:Protein RDR1 n=1 Tax=Microdochium trichocladiopsis TaxID=1682393 RepID=A0A9P8YK10_9PEZI|nr:protein RDR1 [Microdochium trichocladiopsis]KAH7041438.1 protein RDR1 [Microdochium trichocladiopsis]